jgi:hypothetical protein
MPETVSPDIRRMVERFGDAAVAAGLLTRLVIDAGIQVSCLAVERHV